MNGMEPLANRYGRMLRARRAELGMSQARLAAAARVSRSILSRLESGAADVAQTDVLERLCAAAGIDAHPVAASALDRDARIAARAEHGRQQAERRARHYRIAVRLATAPGTMKQAIAAASSRVELWHRKRLCSARYIERWRAVLALPPARMARALLEFGEWEDAMLQNSPWPST